MTIFLTLLIAGAFAAFFPSLAGWWWSIGIVGFLSGFWQGKIKYWKALLAGFLGVSLVWLGHAAYLDSLSQGRLADKVGQILQLATPAARFGALFLVGGLLGLLTVGAGVSLRRLFLPRKRRRRRRY